MSKIKSSTLQAMLDEVAQDFIQALDVKEKSLAKNELAKDDVPEPEQGGEEQSASKPDAMDTGSAPAAPEAAPAEAQPEMPPEAEGQPQDPAADASMDEGALQAEYSKLSPEELEMHLKAAMAAKAALSPPAEEAPAPAPEPEMKAEESMEDSKEESKEESAELSKAMAEIAELKALSKAQSDEIAMLQVGIQKLVDRPERKAVTSVSAPLAKSTKEWTKESIHSHLKSLTQSGKLKKSDRDLVSDFYCGVVSIEKLSHLFEE